VSSNDPDDREPFGAEDAADAAGERSRKRRTRRRLALAALPLVAAVALFAVNGPGGGSAPGPARDTAVAGHPGMAGAPLPSAPTPGATDVTVTQSAADTAAVAGVLPGEDPAGTLPGHGVVESVEGHSVDAEGAAVPTVPTTPSGHRPVALRIADPAALSLVARGDHVDVVGMDGSVLAERLEVLQDRSSGTGSVLVLATPDGASAALAAAALSREVTVILSGAPTVQESAP
jgi:hypothetical protein